MFFKLFFHFFCQIFSIFDVFSKFRSTFAWYAPNWKIIKYAKILAKNEENLCSTSPKSIFRLILAGIPENLTWEPNPSLMYAYIFTHILRRYSWKYAELLHCLFYNGRKFELQFMVVEMMRKGRPHLSLKNDSIHTVCTKSLKSCKFIVWIDKIIDFWQT